MPESVNTTGHSGVWLRDADNPLVPVNQICFQTAPEDLDRFQPEQLVAALIAEGLEEMYHREFTPEWKRLLTHLGGDPMLVDSETCPIYYRSDVGILTMGYKRPYGGTQLRNVLSEDKTMSRVRYLLNEVTDAKYVMIWLTVDVDVNVCPWETLHVMVSRDPITTIEMCELMGGYVLMV